MALIRVFGVWVSEFKVDEVYFWGILGLLAGCFGVFWWVVLVILGFGLNLGFVIGLLSGSCLLLFLVGLGLVFACGLYLRVFELLGVQ